MSQHTPGPWRYSNDLGINAGQATDAWYVYQPDGWTETVAEIKSQGVRGEADARLIAAAPDLLAAARFALSVLQANPVELSEEMAIEKLVAAIAAAQGDARRACTTDDGHVDRGYRP